MTGGEVPCWYPGKVCPLSWSPALSLGTWGPLTEGQEPCALVLCSVPGDLEGQGTWVG